MKFAIKHEIKGRMRIHVAQYRMSCAQADTLLYFLQNDIQVSSAKVYERTGDAVICYDGSRAELIDKLRHFHYEDMEVPNGLIENSGRELNASYQEKLIGRVVRRYASRIFLPYPIRRHERSKYRYSMRRRSECLFCAVIPRRRDRSCSCLASASC